MLGPNLVLLASGLARRFTPTVGHQSIRESTTSMEAQLSLIAYFGICN